MYKTLLGALLLLLLSTVVSSAIYHPQEAERIIRSNLREYYENVLDEVLSSRGSDVILSMGRMRPDRRGGVFETLQKEAGAFGVHDVHGENLSVVRLYRPKMLFSNIILFYFQLHASSNCQK